MSEVILHCESDLISLIISDMSIFMCLMATCISNRHWKNVYSVLLPVSTSGCLFFLMLSCMSYLPMLDINPVSVISSVWQCKYQ